MKKILVILFSLFIFSSRVIAIDDLAPNSKSAVLLEPTTGTIIFEKNKNEKLAPASMTKIMSLLLIMEEIDGNRLRLDDKVLISKTASSMGGSQIFLEEGSTVAVKELLKGIAIASGNDAVVAMAEKIAGSESAFVDLMNKKAQNLGLVNTTFKNSHGLDAEGHLTTAYDMAVIARELLKYPEILNYTKIYEDYFNKPDGTKTWLVNTNRLVRFYEGIDGLKTGFTAEAGYCLTATGIKNNIRFLSVVMGVETSEKRSADTVSLLSYGFNGYKLNKIITKDTDLGTIFVKNGSSEKSKLMIKNDITRLLKNTDDDKIYSWEVKTKDIKAPIKTGDIVGYVRVYSSKEDYNDYDLTIKEDNPKASIFKLTIRYLKYLLN